MPVDVWLVIDDRHEVADDQGKHKVLVHPQTVALQRPAIFVQVSFTLFTFYNTGFSSGIGTKLRDWAVGQAGGRKIQILAFSP